MKSSEKCLKDFFKFACAGCYFLHGQFTEKIDFADAKKAGVSCEFSNFMFPCDIVGFDSPPNRYNGLGMKAPGSRGKPSRPETNKLLSFPPPNLAAQDCLRRDVACNRFSGRGAKVPLEIRNGAWISTVP